MEKNNKNLPRLSGKEENILNLTPENSVYNGFLYKHLNEEHKDIVKYCINWLIGYWECPPLMKYFTDHGKNHCLRLANRSKQFDWILKGLSEPECFCLLMGILLHDIGMQAEVQNFPSIQKYMKNTYNIQFPEKETKGTSEPPLDEIRKYHHLLTAAMLELMYRGNLLELSQRGYVKECLMLGGAGHRVGAQTMQNIIDICKYHSKLNIQALKNRGQDRVQLLAALLRLFDELDITEERISLSYPAFHSIPPENLVYWKVHQCIQCTVNQAERSVDVRFCLSPHDNSRYHVVFLKILKQLEEKNRDVFDVIRESYPIKFVIDDTSVCELNTMNNLPDDDIRRILKTFYSDKRLFEEMLKAAVEKLPAEEKNALIRLTLQSGSRPLLPDNSPFVKELSHNHLFTERINNKIYLRPELSEIVYPRVRETFQRALEQKNPEALSDFPLLDVDLSLACREAQYEKIIAPLLNTYQNREETLQNILLDLLKQIQTAGGNGFAARNLVVLLMALGYDFQGSDLSGLNLDRVDFSRAGTNRTDFNDIFLQNVSFQGTSLRRSRFLERMDQLRSCIFIDREHFVTGDALGEVRIWSMMPPETVCQSLAHCGSVWGLAYDKQTNRLFSCAHDGKIISYSLDQNDGFQPSVLAQKQTWLTCLDYKGELLAAAGGDGNIYFRNLRTGADFSCGETYKEVTYHSIRFDFSGEFLLAGDNQGGLLLLKLNTERTGVEKARRYPNIAAKMIRSIEAHPKRSLFYISGGREIILVEAQAAENLCLEIHYSIPAHKEYIKKLILFSDGIQLFSTANDGWAQLWNISDPIRPKKEGAFQLDDMYSSAAAVSPDGRYLLGAVRNTLTLCLWDLQHTEELWVIQGYQNWLSSLCFFHKKGCFLTGSATGYVSLWSYNGTNGAVNVKNLYRHPHAVNPVAISPDNRYLISGNSSVTGSIYFWDIKESRIVQILNEGTDKGIRALVFLDSLDGCYRFVSAGYDQKVRRWTFHPFENQFTYNILSTRFPGFLGSCAVSGDGTRLAFSVLSKHVPNDIANGEPLNNESHDICVISLKDDRQINIPLEADRIQTLAFTQDGSMLACGDTLGNLYFISMDPPWSLKNKIKVSKEHIGCVAFSSKGDLLACADGSGTVSLWDPAKRQSLSQCQISSGLQLHTVAFAPDNQAILTAGMDGEVYILPLSGGKLGNPLPQHCIRPYEGLCINGAVGLSRQRRDTLKKLGAKEN